MSLRENGTYRCDKCGRDIANAAITEADTISGLDPDQPGRIRLLHLCREPRAGAPRGCAGNVLGPAALANYYETRTP